MQSIIRKYVIMTSLILSVTFLFTGIISVNEETSFVISGKKEDVLRVQSTTSERLLVSENEDTQTEIWSVNSEKAKNTAIILLAALLPSPFSQIVWGISGE